MYIYIIIYSLYSHMDPLGSRPPSAHKRVLPGAGFTCDYRYRGCNLERCSGTCSSLAGRSFWIADVHPPPKQIPSPNPWSTYGIDHSGFGLGWIPSSRLRKPMVLACSPRSTLPLAELQVRTLSDTRYCIAEGIQR